MNLDGSDWNEEMLNDVFGETAVTEKLLVVLVDFSGSMEGTVIGTVHSIMEELLSDLEDDQTKRAILVGSFGEELLWSSDQAIPADRFGAWRRVKVSSFSNMGQMFRELGEKLSNPQFCPGASGTIDAAFLLFSDGLATDRYQEGLESLKSVPLFREGRKLAVNFSELYDERMLVDFAGDKTQVLLMKTQDVSNAKKQIHAFIKA